VECPACGSSEHDGWNTREGCPADWRVVPEFVAQRWMQLLGDGEKTLADDLLGRLT
jgi:hypothetical protein